MMYLTVRHACFQTLFADVTGQVCLLSESVQNRPVIVLGVHRNAMVLGMRDVRDLLPHLQRFVQTGRMLPDEGEDYQI
jgi:hypothetical protein